MPTITISGPAEAFADDPRDGELIADRATLLRFHGLVSEDSCTDTIDDPLLVKLDLDGGHLRFVVDAKKPILRITTTYTVPRRLTDAETKALVEATRTQWSDGIGSGLFDNFAGPVLSTSLAIALLNSGQTEEDIGAAFVDAFPMSSTEEPRVDYTDGDDETTDLGFLQEAAEEGEPHAQFELARLLEDGESVEQDEVAAFALYEKAAAQGHLFALTFMGMCYQNGTGTEQDMERGFECFTQAAEEGIPLAMHCLGECYLEGNGVEADPDEGIRWYQEGAEMGDVGCMAELGDCYEHGKGVEQDLHQALELYEACIEDGFDAVEPAIQRVKKLLKKGEK